MSAAENLLANINGPADIKKLSQDQLPRLSEEVAELIKRVVSKTGGHYSSPLGVVDLTIALHHVFNSPEDSIIWDVGHQAYAHKILTGRRDQFHTLRTKDGISGFLKRSESEHDIFGAGHASTSISAGAGIAEANRLAGNGRHVVAVIGDGALTGGLAYEGLNNIGFKKLRMTVVLNDNKMSISPSVGSFSKYLTKVVANPLYNRIREDMYKITGKLPLGKDTIRTFFRRMEEALKSTISPGLVFDEWGLRYFGPIDGHDYDAMLSVFSNVRQLPYSTLIHVITRKGRGAKEAESDSLQYYSIGGANNLKPKNLVPDYFKVAGKVATEMGTANENVCAVTAAMVVGTGLTEFAKAHPDRLFDVGIAEEHAVTFAGGLATQGRRPIVAIYSTFMQRAFDHVLHDIALQNLPVIFCLDRSGVVGPDGPTHHGVFDLSIFRTIPGVIVCAPKDGNELRNLMFSALDWNKPTMIRYPKDTSVKFDKDGKPTFIASGSWEILRDGGDVAILAVGSMVEVARKAAVTLAEKHQISAKVINARFVKPLDKDMLSDLAEQNIPIVTVEEGLVAGGFGSAVLMQIGQAASLIAIMGIDDEFTEHGTRAELLEMIGLTSANIVKRATEIIAKVAAV